MNEEEQEIRARAEIEVGGDLSMLSIEELEKRIGFLEQEISRIRQDIVTKKTSKEAAESIFKS